MMTKKKKKKTSFKYVDVNFNTQLNLMKRRCEVCEREKGTTQREIQPKEWTNKDMVIGPGTPNRTHEDRTENIKKNIDRKQEHSSGVVQCTCLLFGDLNQFFFVIDEFHLQNVICFLQTIHTHTQSHTNPDTYTVTMINEYKL